MIIFLYGKEVNMLAVRYIVLVTGRAFFDWGGLNVIVATRDYTKQDAFFPGPVQVKLRRPDNGSPEVFFGMS